MVGYVGWSKSNNAILAENEGKLPLSRAIRAVAKAVPCSQRVARENLEAIGSCEWHHTSKHYNITYYYEVEAAVHRARSAGIIAALEGLNFRTRLASVARINQPGDWQRLVEELAAQAGTTPDIVERAYYNGWSTVALVHE